MAIGAQLARAGKQVVLIIGDGGLGISGFDLETARRYGLPIVAVLWNNRDRASTKCHFWRVGPIRSRYYRTNVTTGCSSSWIVNPERISPRTVYQGSKLCCSALQLGVLCPRIFTI
jgi:thiamine pyrophosphate-dependent enzyme